MESTEKTVLLVGGAAIVGFLLLGYLKQSSAAASANANEPGLNYQPQVPSYSTSAQSAFASVLGSASSAFSNMLANGFSSSVGGANDPGLDDNSYVQSTAQISSSGGSSFDGTADGGYDPSEDFFA